VRGDLSSQKKNSFGWGRKLGKVLLQGGGEADKALRRGRSESSYEKKKEGRVEIGIVRRTTAETKGREKEKEVIDRLRWGGYVFVFTPVLRKERGGGKEGVGLAGVSIHRGSGFWPGGKMRGRWPLISAIVLHRKGKKKGGKPRWPGQEIDF